MRSQSVEAHSVIANEVFVHPVVCDQDFQHARQERDVAALGNGEPVIRDVSAEKRAAERGRYPVSFHARLQIRIHQRHFCAKPFGFMQIFCRHRLVVGRIRAEEHDQVRSIPVLVTARRRGDTDGMFHSSGAGRVAETGCVVHIVRPEEARDLLRHVIDFIRDSP